MADENSSKLKGSVDPGWNDPPLFTYENRQSHGKGYSLNKRVAYSMDGKKEDKQDTSVMNFPPTGPPPSKLPPIGVDSNKLLPTNEIAQVTNEASLTNKKIELKSVLDNFNTTLEEVFSDKNEKEPSEIKRRLAMMEKMWTDGKFPAEMQQKLYDISEALRENKFDECDRLQRCVMVDHSSMCSTWMAAIRLLINSKRSSH